MISKTLLIGLAAVAPLATAMRAQEVSVPLDLDQRGEPISPYIYGQFIEHLGRCIYGGIWAEMLEDRKFYFPVSADYDPYKSLQDTDYPVVGASPWEILGDAAGVAMDTEDPFVGEQAPRVAPGSGLRQRDLGVVAGKSYEGYAWLKNAGKTKARVTVALSAGLEGEAFGEKALSVASGEYRKYAFSFTADASTDKAALSLRVEGGAVQIGTISLMPEDNVDGMRADTLAVLKELDAPVYRWPGGNFVSGYNWRDGIGDRDRRPPRKNPAWTGVEHNDFGTDEFVAFCRAIGTEPMIAANTGLGDAYSAAQWVEYANRGADTIGGKWRIENGNKQPYGVRHWCIGNEMWGPWQLGFMQLNHYIIKHNEVVDAMRAVDDDLVLVGVGAIDQLNAAYDPDAVKANRFWTQGMLESSGDHMEMISEHFYAGRTPWTEIGELPPVEHVPLLKQNIRRIVDLHRELQPKIEQLDGKTMPIAMDEWNYWHRDYQYGELGCVYDLKDALGVVMGLHEFYRHSDLIHMANYAQTVNVIGCIKTSKTDAQMDTTGVALALYRAQWQELPLRLADEYAPLDVAASISPDGSVLTISVVNPTEEDATINVDLGAAALPATAAAWTISGPDHRASNAPGSPRAVDAARQDRASVADGFAAPAMSSVLYRLELAKR